MCVCVRSCGSRHFASFLSACVCVCVCVRACVTPCARQPAFIHASLSLSLSLSVCVCVCVCKKAHVHSVDEGTGRVVMMAKSIGMRPFFFEHVVGEKGGQADLSVSLSVSVFRLSVSVNLRLFVLPVC